VQADDAHLVAVVHRHGPGTARAPAAHGDVPADADQAGARDAKQIGHPFGRPALGDPAQIQPTGRVHRPGDLVDRDRTARDGRRRSGAIGCDLGERPVVAGGTNRSEHGRVKAPARLLPQRARPPDEPQQIRRDRTPARAVPERKLGTGIEPAGHALQAPDLGLGRIQGAGGVVATVVEQQQHIGAHRPKRPACRHEDPELATGGSGT